MTFLACDVAFSVDGTMTEIDGSQEKSLMDRLLTVERGNDNALSTAQDKANLVTPLPYTTHSAGVAAIAFSSKGSGADKVAWARLRPKRNTATMV